MLLLGFQLTFPFLCLPYKSAEMTTQPNVISCRKSLRLRMDECPTFLPQPLPTLLSHRHINSRAGRVGAAYRVRMLSLPGWRKGTPHSWLSCSSTTVRHLCLCHSSGLRPHLKPMRTAPRVANKLLWKL